MTVTEVSVIFFFFWQKSWKKNLLIVYYYNEYRLLYKVINLSFSDISAFVLTILSIIWHSTVALGYKTLMWFHTGEGNSGMAHFKAWFYSRSVSFLYWNYSQKLSATLYRPYWQWILISAIFFGSWYQP